jgi:hypothetical protein
MGYYVNALQEGCLYDLGGMRLEFSKKVGKLFYFYIHKLDDFGFTYEKTNNMVSYNNKELTYIRRIQECSPKGTLKKIGKDRVFSRL